MRESSLQQRKMSDCSRLYVTSLIQSTQQVCWNTVGISGCNISLKHWLEAAIVDSVTKSEHISFVKMTSRNSRNNSGLPCAPFPSLTFNCANKIMRKVYLDSWYWLHSGLYGLSNGKSPSELPGKSFIAISNLLTISSQKLLAESD